MKFRFRGLLGHGTVLFLFLALSGFFLLLTSTEADRHGSYQRFLAERVGEELFRSVRDGLITDTGGLPEQVDGFAYYNPSGYPLVALGAVPSTLDPGYFPPQNTPHRVQGEGDSVFFIKTLSPPRLPMRHPFGNPEDPERGSTQVQGFLLVHLLDPGTRYYPLILWSVYGFLQLGLILGGILAWKLQYRNRELARQLREKEETAFLGDAGAVLAHEIKTPLSTILLQARLLDALPEARSTGEVIAQEASRIVRLVERVRDLVRDPRGTPEVLDLTSLLPSLGLGDLELQVPSEPAIIAMDPLRFRSVLENLVQNARESQETAVPPPLVRVSLTEKAVSLEVMDRGTGLESGHGSRLFTPFHTTKAQGTGLGLALVRRFLEGAGGSAEIHPRPGGGTVARLTWPLYKGEFHDPSGG